MTKKRAPQKNKKMTETLDLTENQASQVKGGITPLLHKALTQNESIMAPRDVATGLPSGRK